MLLRLTEDVVAAIIAHARTGHPDEVCGLVAGPPGAGIRIYPGRNVSPHPRVAYELDAETTARQVEIEDAGLTLVAIYHSHPAGPEIPSQADVARAFYPDSVYLICSLYDPDVPVLRGFRIVEGVVREVRCLVVEPGDA